MNHDIHTTTATSRAAGAAAGRALSGRRHRRAVLALPLIATAATAAILAAGSPAAAKSPAETPLACGAVVTRDVRLRHDLVDCPGAGLVVGAAGVTIDLGGHVVDGSGVATGIDNGAGHDRLTIRNGTVRDFLFGIHAFDTRGVRISGVTVEHNTDGMKIERSSRVTIDDSVANDNALTGIDVTFSEQVLVARKSASGGLLGGLVDRFSRSTRIERSTFTGNVGPGITVEHNTSVAIERNVVASNDSDGLVLTAIDRGSVTRNTVTGNTGRGLRVEDSTVRIRRNHIAGNGAPDCVAPSCD